MSADAINKLRNVQPEDVELGEKVKNIGGKPNNYRDWALYLIILKIILVFSVIMLMGFGFGGFKLEKDVAIVYITSSLGITAVIGVVVTVVKPIIQPVVERYLTKID